MLLPVCHKIFVIVKARQAVVQNVKSWVIIWCLLTSLKPKHLVINLVTPVLILKISLICLHSVFRSSVHFSKAMIVFILYQIIGFYNWVGTCLMRGKNWISNIINYNFSLMRSIYLSFCQIYSKGISEALCNFFLRGTSVLRNDKHWNFSLFYRSFFYRYGFCY
jgi:hypothetical protein